MMALGLDIGGTAIKSMVVDVTGAIVGRASRETPASSGVEACLGAIEAAADAALEDAGLRRHHMVGAGVGVPGIVLSKTGIVRTVANLDGWSDVPLRQLLASRLGMIVVLANDANAAALGEARFGAGRGIGNLVLLTLGTGIGGGVIMNHQIVEGGNGLAGEIGHMRIEMTRPRPCGCGRFGCLEAYAGAKGLIKRTHEALADDWKRHSALHEVAEGRSIEAVDVFRLADDGDFLAIRLIDDTALALAAGIVNVMHLLDPDLVLLSGGMTAAGPGFLDKVCSFVRELALEPVAGTPIRYAALGADAGGIGAAALILK
jgi:glucokinase